MGLAKMAVSAAAKNPEMLNMAKNAASEAAKNPDALKALAGNAGALAGNAGALKGLASSMGSGAGGGSNPAAAIMGSLMGPSEPAPASQNSGEHSDPAVLAVSDETATIIVSAALETAKDLTRESEIADNIEKIIIYNLSKDYASQVTKMETILAFIDETGTDENKSLVQRMQQDIDKIKQELSIRSAIEEKIEAKTDNRTEVNPMQKSDIVLPTSSNSKQINVVPPIPLKGTVAEEGEQGSAEEGGEKVGEGEEKVEGKEGSAEEGGEKVGEGEEKVEGKEGLVEEGEEKEYEEVENRDVAAVPAQLEGEPAQEGEPVVAQAQVVAEAQVEAPVVAQAPVSVEEPAQAQAQAPVAEAPTGQVGGNDIKKYRERYSRRLKTLDKSMKKEIKKQKIKATARKYVPKNKITIKKR